MIAAEVRERYEELIALANTRDGGGEFLFSGFATATQPFVRGAGGIIYQGDQGQRLVQIGQDRTVADSDSGAALFMQARNGNGVFRVTSLASNTGTGLLGERTVVNPLAVRSGQLHNHLHRSRQLGGARRREPGGRAAAPTCRGRPLHFAAFPSS